MSFVKERKSSYRRVLVSFNKTKTNPTTLLSLNRGRKRNSLVYILKSVPA